MLCPLSLPSNSLALDASFKGITSTSHSMLLVYTFHQLNIPLLYTYGDFRRISPARLLWLSCTPQKASVGNLIANTIALRGVNFKSGLASVLSAEMGSYRILTSTSFPSHPSPPSYWWYHKKGLTKSQHLALDLSLENCEVISFLFYINHPTSGIVFLQHRTDGDTDLCKPFHLCRRGLICASSVKQKRLVGVYYPFE